MVRVYETLTGALKFEQKKHTDWIYTARFSPDGLLLATGDRSSGLVVWETQTGRLYMDLQGHKGEIRSITWRPDSAALISSSTDGTLKMWDMNSGTVIKSWDAHPGGALAVATCNDGTIASTGRDNKVKVWDAGGNLAGEMPALVEAGHQVAISVDSKQVIAGDWAGNVRLWQRANPADEKALRANPAPLEQTLAKLTAEQQRVDQLVKALDQRYQAESSQQSALQQQLQTLQAEVTQLATQIQTATAQQNELKPVVEQLDAQYKAKQVEIAPLKVTFDSKSSMLDLANRNLKDYESQLQALIAKLQAEGETPEAVQSKSADAKNQCEIQKVAMAQISAEIEPLKQSIAKLEQESVTIKAELDPKQQKLTELAANLTQWVAQHTEKVKLVEPATVALKAAVDKANATKVELDSAQAQLVALQSQVQKVQADLVAFQNRLQELTVQRDTLGKSMESLTGQLAPVETDISAKMSESEQVVKGMAELEQKLAELQKQIADQKAKKDAIAAALAGQQAEAAKLKEQQQKIELDAASLQLQMDLFNQAFKK
jgi:chromosome segregation ATPase